MEPTDWKRRVRRAYQEKIEKKTQSCNLTDCLEGKASWKRPLQVVCGSTTA